MVAFVSGLIAAPALVPLSAPSAMSAPLADHAQLTVHVITPDQDNVSGATITVPHGSSVLPA
jgi:hypothetical protein